MKQITQQETLNTERGIKNMAVAGRILMLPSGVWKSGSNYTFLDVVTHSGSSYVAKNNINNSTKAPPSDTTNWQLIATGYPGNAAGVSAKDTQGMVVTSGSNSTVQALIDAIADKVMTKLLAKTDIVQTESTATNKVPSSAYLKQVKADINSNLAKTNAKVTLNGVKNINGFTAVYSDRTDRAFQLYYENGEIASIAFNNTGIWYDFYDGQRWKQVWKFNKPS